MTWLAAPYHRAMVDGFLAAYQRDVPALLTAIDGLKQTAGTSLEVFDIERFSRRFKYLIS
jgi:ABC-type xylose transport system substrate-binding protein